MTGPDLRSALHDLGQDARVPDLLDRALATSRRIRRRRIAAGAAGTAAVLVMATFAVATVRPSNGTVAPPATGGTTTPSAGSSAPPPGTPPALAGTVYYLAPGGGSQYYSLYSVTGSGAPKLVGPDVTHVVTVSPDATKLAWIEGSGDGDPTDTVMVSDLDGANERAVAEAQDSGGLCNGTAWTPDSRRILFQPSGGSNVPWATVDVSNGERATTLESPTGCYPTWSPDGGTIGWYVGGPGASAILTDARGRDVRTIPPTDGVRAPCGMSIHGVGAGGRRALVNRPEPDQLSCGDGPGRTVLAGVVVDTSTGRSLDLPVEGGLSSAVFLTDGGLVGRSALTGELVLLDAGLKLVARSPMRPGTDVILLAYVP